jgi:hypothetical protein
MTAKALGLTIPPSVLALIPRMLRCDACWRKG